MDQQALEHWIEQHGEQLLRLAYTYVRDHQVAEDVVQDVLLKAYERQQQFEGRAAYKTYLMRMTINRSLDYLRSWHYRQLIVTEKITNWMKVPAVSPPEQDTALGQAILQLPIKYREVIVLYYYEDLRLEHIATLLQLPISTVKTRMQRAKKRLKVLLEEAPTYER